MSVSVAASCKLFLSFLLLTFLLLLFSLPGVTVLTNLWNYSHTNTPLTFFFCLRSIIVNNDYLLFSWKNKMSAVSMFHVSRPTAVPVFTHKHKAFPSDTCSKQQSRGTRFALNHK